MKLLLKYLILELPRIIFIFFLVVILFTGEVDRIFTVLSEYYIEQYGLMNVIVVECVIILGIVLKGIQIILFNKEVDKNLKDDVNSN